MKKIILMVFSVVLGILLLNMLISDDPNSLKEQSKKVFQYQVDYYK